MWLSVDPLAEMFPGRSSYEYCFSNPINYTDPTGMSPEGGGDGDPLPVGTVIEGVSHAGDLNEVVVSPNVISGSSVPSSESDKYSYGGTPSQYVKQYGFMTHNEWQEKHGSAWNKYRHQLIREEANERALAHLKVWLTFFDQIEDVAQVMPGSALGNLGRGLGKTFLGGLKGLSGSGGNISLFRAVSKAELDDLASSGFRNANGYETGKLFATSAQDASNFGQLLFKHDNIPFTIIKTSLPKRFGFKLFKGEMDLMPGVSVPENLFNNLSKPSILDSAPLGNHPWLKK